MGVRWLPAEESRGCGLAAVYDGFGCGVVVILLLIRRYLRRSDRGKWICGSIVVL